MKSMRRETKEVLGVNDRDKKKVKKKKVKGIILRNEKNVKVLITNEKNTI